LEIIQLRDTIVQIGYLYQDKCLDVETKNISIEIKIISTSLPVIIVWSEK